MKFTKPDLSKGYKLLHKGTEALSRMERHGVKIDVEYLDSAIEKVKRRISKMEDNFKRGKFYKKWFDTFGTKTNIYSPTQLGEVLQSHGYDTGELTEKTKKVKTDEHSLRKLNLPFVNKYLAIKKQDRVLSTYLLGIKRELDPKGYLHPFYNLAASETKGGAKSYRGSSSMPNFQNIPKRNKVMEALIRPCFIAREGCYLVERDFSGIEVRVAACYTKDPNLMKYVKDDTTDMHRDEAMNLFMLKREEVFKGTTRDSAKNMWVFPQFYGSVYFQCAPNIWEAMIKRDFRVGEDGASLMDHLRGKGIKELGNCNADYVREHGTKEGTFVHHLKLCQQKLWDERFPAYKKWKQDWYECYLRNGWFPLYTGFICQGYYQRNQVLNYSIQGSAFHFMLWSIIEITKEIIKNGMRTRLVGQIHDSLLADVPENEIQAYLDLSRDIMSRRMPKFYDWINVPIDTEVDVSPIGKSWVDKQEWVNNKGLWQPKDKDKWREACLSA